MEKYILLLFSFIVVFSLVSIVWFINPATDSMVYGGGSRPGYAVNTLTTQRIVKPAGGDGIPRGTHLRKGALESFGGSACPAGYRLASKYECRFTPCIPVATDFVDVNPGKQCKPIVFKVPIYPKQGILK